jgi:hypothetical protein
MIAPGGGLASALLPPGQISNGGSDRLAASLDNDLLAEGESDSDALNRSILEALWANLSLHPSAVDFDPVASHAAECAVADAVHTEADSDWYLA